MSKTIIKNWIAKQLFKKGGAIANTKSVEFSSNDLIKRLSKYNIRPDDITSEDQLLRVLGSVKQAEDNMFSNRFKGILENNIFNKGSGQKSAEVFDLKGKKIKNPQNIMGGEEIIETEAQILKRLNKENKESLSNMRYEAASKAEEAKAAADEDYIIKLFDPEDFAQGGRAGLYRGGQAEIEPSLSDIGHGSDALMARNMLIAPGSQATTSTGLNYLLGEDNDTTRVPYKDAGPVVLPKTKPNADPMVELVRVYNLYQESMPGVSQETQKYLQQDFIQKLNDAGISQEQFMSSQMQNNFAEGGPARQNFAMGKRAFLQWMAGAGAGIGAAKSGLFSLLKGGGKKQVVKEAVKSAGSGTPPPYFFKLVEKIKALGDDVTESAATLDRQKVTKYKDFEMTEDVTGKIEIQKKGMLEGDESGLQLGEEVYMSHTPGETIIGKNKKPIKTKPEYTEDTSYIRTDRGNRGGIHRVDDGVPQSVLDEVEAGSGNVPESFYTGLNKIKRADGGRIGYGKGDIVTKGIPALIKQVNKLFGKEVVTTADKLPIPKKILDRDLFNRANKRLNEKRMMNADELEDFEMEIGDALEAYDFDGTVGNAKQILKEQKDYQAYMYDQYKTGRLDPVAGDKSPARKRFLQNKLDEAEASGDNRLITRDEMDELESFDLSIDDIKTGVDDVMKDTSPAGLKRSIEIDNLMLKYPGMTRELADQIASSSPTMKADMIAMVEQTFKMDEMGMSGDDIIQTFKNTSRTKQASGGRVPLSGGGGLLKLLKSLKPKPKKLETVKDFIEKRNFLKGMIGNSEKNRNKRILDKILEENKKVKGFEFENIDIDKEIRPIFDQSKDRKLHSTGGLAAMLGE